MTEKLIIDPITSEALTLSLSFLNFMTVEIIRERLEQSGNDSDDLLGMWVQKWRQSLELYFSQILEQHQETLKSNSALAKMMINKMKTTAERHQELDELLLKSEEFVYSYFGKKRPEDSN